MKPSCNNSRVVHGISAGPIGAGRSGRGPVAGCVGPCQVARSRCKWRVFCATRWLCLRTHLYNECVPFRHVSSKRADQRLTERRNPASTNLDRLSAEAIVRLMNREDSKIATAVAREIRSIARAVDAIVQSIQRGGRLFYVGAGSSGRLGVLDAAECAPTFGTSRKLVQALIAGGRRAVTDAVEGAAICAEAWGDDGGSDCQSRHARRSNCENLDRAGGRPRSTDGINAAEGRHSAKNGSQHAIYCRDGAVRTCI